MIYLLIGITIIALTNLGTLSILTHYIDRDIKEEPKITKEKVIKEKGQAKAKKRRKR